MDMTRNSFVCLRSGSIAGAVFLIPGLGGNTEELRAFATLLEPDIAIYVSRVIGPDTTRGNTRVEAIANTCVTDILSIQPGGNYILAGYSFGGLVAFEAAKRLLSGGRTVRLLGLIECCPDEGISARLIRRKLVGIAKTPMNEIPAKASMTFKDFLFRLKVRFGISVLRQAGAGRLPEQAIDNKIINKVALQKYRPFKGPLDMTFFKATVRLGEFPPDPLRVWRPLVRRLTIEQVPGDHHTMIRAHAAALAAVFTRHLKVALAD